MTACNVARITRSARAAARVTHELPRSRELTGGERSLWCELAAGACSRSLQRARRPLLHRKSPFCVRRTIWRLLGRPEGCRGGASGRMMRPALAALVGVTMARKLDRSIPAFEAAGLPLRADPDDWDEGGDGLARNSGRRMNRRSGRTDPAGGDRRNGVPRSVAHAGALAAAQRDTRSFACRIVGEQVTDDSLGHLRVGAARSSAVRGSLRS